jgi:hypothetical protein
MFIGFPSSLENKKIQLYHTTYYSEYEEEDLGELKLI